MDCLLFKTFSVYYGETAVKQITIDLLCSHTRREREACLTNIESVGYQAL